MKKAYDKTDVQRLLPLLRSIGLELTERLHEARILQGRVAAHERSGGEVSDLLELRGALAEHRREIRLAEKELERLGCTLDDAHPGRILIPGADGDVAQGYAWTADDPMLRRVSTGTAVGPHGG